jgi:hypothetical protein
VRLPLVLLCCSLAGIIGGAALISLPAVGGAVIFDCLCTAAWALWGYDDGKASPSVHAVPRTLQDVFDRARNAS